MKCEIGDKYIYDNSLIIKIIEIKEKSIKGDIIYYITDSMKAKKFPTGYYITIESFSKLRKLNKKDMIMFL